MPKTFSPDIADEIEEIHTKLRLVNGQLGSLVEDLEQTQFKEVQAELNRVLIKFAQVRRGER